MDHYPDYAVVGHTFTVDSDFKPSDTSHHQPEPGSSTSPSPPPVQTAPRPKMKKFDIRISHLSEITDGGAGNVGKTRLGTEGKESVAGPSRVKKQRAGRERAKIQLAPDQPPTTQGKQRERVYVACAQCRSRKIRCDGARPLCYNCVHRNTGKCDYDPVPKRRGPDRNPGSRQRPGRAKQDNADDSPGDGEQDKDGSGAGESTPKAARKRTSLSSTTPSDTSATWVNVQPPDTSEAGLQHHRGATPPEDPGGTSSQNDLPAQRTPVPSFAYSISDDHSGHQPIVSAGTGVSSPQIVVSRLSTETTFFSSSRRRSATLASEQESPVEYGHPSRFMNVGTIPTSLDSSSTVAPPVASHAGPDASSYHFQHTPSNTYAPLQGRAAALSTPTLTTNVNEFGRRCSVGYQDAPPDSAGGILPSTSSGRSRISSSASPTSSGYGDYSSPEVTLSSQPLVVESSIANDQQDNSHLEYVSLQHPPLQGASLSTLGTDIGAVEVQTGCTVFDPNTITHVAPDQFSYNPYQWAVPPDDTSVGYDHAHGAYIVNTDVVQNAQQQQEQQRRNFNARVSRSPSLDFVRKTWWDFLLETYTYEQYCPPAVAAHAEALHGMSIIGGRAQAAALITRDLQFLIRNSNYWFAFINVPLFFATLHDIRSRETMQPALIYASLAMSNFFRSSEAELGAVGRQRALWLVDKAHAALQASVDASWIDGGLAQAAWMLTVFEVSAHPARSVARTQSAFAMLDNIIRALSLTYIDAEDPSTTTFGESEDPRHPDQREPAYPLPLYSRSQGLNEYPQAVPSSRLLHHEPHPKPSNNRCICNELSLGRNWPGAQEHAPLWLSTAAWDPSWSVAEIRREECRRLCWNALTIAAGYTTYRSAHGLDSPDMFVLQPSNFRLLFPGENLTSLSVPRDSNAGPASPVSGGKETVWALYSRSMLLWHACLRIRGQNVSDHIRSVFANAVWREAEAIEMALDEHTCQLERAFLFQGREYLFNARMHVSYEYRRFVPQSNTEMSGAVHRTKALEWLTHQATVAKRVMLGLHTVTMQKTNLLARRPFFVFWFMAQIARCLQLWTLDKTLTIAVQLSKEFLAPIDYLTSLWPSEDQRNQYAVIRHQLTQACITIGIDPPPPPNFSLPNLSVQPLV